ncbi:MAG TPA: exodeoxyribonuclease VII small subunit [Acidobacteriaceae bacterium]|nr:exodeoxyribonuclease VII small subunit [Acidobacteriaceae bacterium]
MENFEQSLKKLETIVAQMERGDVSLEESVKLFEEGSKLADQCKQQLAEAEGKVEILIKQRNGAMKREPFE